EEADGLAGGGGGQADQEGVEVVEHLAPEVVDGAVALVGHDKVEGLDGEGRVVDDGERLLDQGGVGLEEGALLVALVELGLAPEDGVEALDGGDADLAHRVD